MEAEGGAVMGAVDSLYVRLPTQEILTLRTLVQDELGQRRSLESGRKSGQHFRNLPNVLKVSHFPCPAMTGEMAKPDFTALLLSRALGHLGPNTDGTPTTGAGRNRSRAGSR